MTDPYANIRRALKMLGPGNSTQEQIAALDDLDHACDPDTIRALLAERDALAAALEAARGDAERYRWALNNSCWIRGEHAAYVAIPVAREADLSCVAMRDAAIDQARRKEDGNG